MTFASCKGPASRVNFTLADVRSNSPFWVGVGAEMPAFIGGLCVQVGELGKRPPCQASLRDGMQALRADVPLLPIAAWGSQKWELSNLTIHAQDLDSLQLLADECSICSLYVTKTHFIELVLACSETIFLPTYQLDLHVGPILAARHSLVVW